MNAFAESLLENKKLVWIVALALLVALVMAQPAWADHEGESDWNITFHETLTASSSASTENRGGGYSGDDVYDPAAGGNPEVSLARPFQAASGGYGELAAGSQAARAEDGPRYLLPSGEWASGPQVARTEDGPRYLLPSGEWASESQVARAEDGPRYLLPSSAAGISAASSDENAAFLASNPELSAARNYSAAGISIAGSDGFATFSANPELKTLEGYCSC
jgi:hypothetical protein